MDPEKQAAEDLKAQQLKTARAIGAMPGPKTVGKGTQTILRGGQLVPQGAPPRIQAALDLIKAPTTAPDVLLAAVRDGEKAFQEIEKAITQAGPEKS